MTVGGFSGTKDLVGWILLDLVRARKWREKRRCRNSLRALLMVLLAALMLDRDFRHPARIYGPRLSRFTKRRYNLCLSWRKGSLHSSANYKVRELLPTWRVL